MLAFVDLEERVPRNHPLRAIKQFADRALAECLLKHDVAQQFFDEAVRQAAGLGLLSDEHFTVDGTLIEAAASLKSFRPMDKPPSDEPPPDDPGNPTVEPSWLAVWWRPPTTSSNWSG
jgi:transposase